MYWFIVIHSDLTTMVFLSKEPINRMKIKIYGSKKFKLIYPLTTTDIPMVLPILPKMLEASFSLMSIENA